MQENIRDKQSIALLAGQYPVHFSSSPVSWQMEYDIASKILAREKGSERITYAFELVNYCFYYMLLPVKFRNTFFLLHGLPVRQNMDEWQRLTGRIGSKRYVIYKTGQELLNSYVCSVDVLSKVDRQLINQGNAYYSLGEVENDNEVKSDLIIIIQVQDRKN